MVRSHLPSGAHVATQPAMNALLPRVLQTVVVSSRDGVQVVVRRAVRSIACSQHEQLYYV